MTTVQRAKLATAKSTRTFFKDPLWHIFLIGLLGLTIGLLLGYSFSWQTYAIVLGTGLFVVTRDGLRYYLEQEK